MLINNININKFNAKVEKKMFDHGKDETGKGTLNIRIFFSGTNRDDVHRNISNFMAMNMNECIIKFRNISNYFNASYVDHSLEETELDEYLFLEIEFEYFEFGAEITHSFMSQSTLDIKGNLETEVKISITARSDLIDCVLVGTTEDDIVIRKLTANKPIIIDSINGLIIEEGKNKFKDVELWDFPKLKPGTNTISVNKENINIELKYTPKWR